MFSSCQSNLVEFIIRPGPTKPLDHFHSSSTSPSLHPLDPSLFGALLEFGSPCPLFSSYDLLQKERIRSSEPDEDYNYQEEEEEAANCDGELQWKHYRYPELVGDGFGGSMPPRNPLR